SPVFLPFSVQHLARRLLGGRSASEEEEKKMIVKLKAECGQQYTSKLEVMYRDMQASDDVMRQYHAREDLQRDTACPVSLLDARLLQLGRAIARRAGTFASASGSFSASALHQPVDDTVRSPNDPNASDSPESPAFTTPLPSSSSASSSSSSSSSAPSSSSSSASSFAPCPPSSSVWGCEVPQGRGEFEYSVRVITQGTWPVDAQTLISETQLLPSLLAEEATRFEAFYLGRHNGRVLRWNLAQGKASVRGQLLHSRHEFECTTLQMIFLLAFNFFPSTPVSVSDLLQPFFAVSSSLSRAELKRHLISLTTPRCKILLRASSGAGAANAAELKDSDTLTVNLSYTNKLRRVRVPLVAVPAAAGSGEAADAWATPHLEAQAGADVPSSVEQDRNYLVEAAIVRVMKTRRRMIHNDLLVEVTRHLAQRFRPSPALIKQRVEKLIEREFLERDAADRRMYNYLA
ncbi:putative cullin 3, partial [Toxoplasma gondii MAS]